MKDYAKCTDSDFLKNNTAFMHGVGVYFAQRKTHDFVTWYKKKKKKRKKVIDTFIFKTCTLMAPRSVAVLYHQGPKFQQSIFWEMREGGGWE